VGALAAAGQAGVERALAILREELVLTLTLMGTPRPSDVGPSHVAVVAPTPATAALPD
jgi:isopentenyl diphosphate isomerase/L-lactate dehydrogenase-like FMN-dependent dehydrogenase